MPLAIRLYIVSKFKDVKFKVDAKFNIEMII